MGEDRSLWSCDNVDSAPALWAVGAWVASVEEASRSAARTVKASAREVDAGEREQWGQQRPQTQHYEPSPITLCKH